MKLALLFPPLAGLACLCLAGCATNLQRSAYQDASKINKYSRRDMLARAPDLRAIPHYAPVPYRYASAPVAAPEHSYSTESIYNEPGYRPASTYGGAYVASDVGGFGGRAYRYNTSYGYGYPYADAYYGGYYPGSAVIVSPRGGHYHGGYGRGGVSLRSGGVYGRFR